MVQEITKKELNSVIVTEDCQFASLLVEFLRNNSGIAVRETFNCPEHFLMCESQIRYDLCILELGMKKINSLHVAKSIKTRSIIFIAESDSLLYEALSLNPIGIIIKPFQKKNVISEIEKAKKILNQISQKEYAFFNVAESRGKIKLKTSDIIFAGTDEIDSRHKSIILKDQKRYTLMNISLEELLTLNQSLIQVNKRELVAMEAVFKMDSDSLTLNCKNENGGLKEITLSKFFRAKMSKLL